MQPATRVAVTVTFLRMEQPPAGTARPLPEGASVVRARHCSVAFYRYLYDTVGGPHLWWMRRTLTDAVLGDVLADPAISVHVLYTAGEPAGFFELDGRAAAAMNIAYFGLMPDAIGRGLGTAFLRAAVDAGFALGSRPLTVNTCTADHPRALGSYLRAGFSPVRTVREVWDIPNRLGLAIPPHLRA